MYINRRKASINLYTASHVVFVLLLVVSSFWKLANKADSWDCLEHEQLGRELVWRFDIHGLDMASENRSLFVPR